MTLRFQVGVAASVLCFAIVTVLALSAAVVGRNEAVEAATNNLNDIASTFTERLSRGISTRVGLVEHLAALQPLRQIWLGPPQPVRRLLADTRQVFPDTAWIGFAGRDGTIRAAAGGAFEGQSVAHHAWFTRGLQRATVVDSATEGARAEGSPVFADTSIQRIIEIGVPVRNSSGVVVGVLGLYLGHQWADRLRAGTIADSDHSLGIRLALIGAAGGTALGDGPSMAAISDSTRLAMLEARQGVLPAVDDNGFLTAFSVIDGGGVRPTWIAVARQSAATAYRAADRVVWTIVALGALLGFAGIAGAVVIAARVSRPFHKLADKAALIGRDSNELLPRVRGSFEAVRLSAALRALVLRLSSAEKSTVEAQHQAADAARRLNSDIAKLRNLADADTLTELLNRRAFMEFGKRAMEESRRTGETFAILMIDIDNFKRVNDSFGHGAGDIVIRSVADTVARMLRPSDKGARFGGEEFVTLLQMVSLDEAQEIAEQLRARVAAIPVEMSDRELFMTVSIGVAVCHAGDRSIQDLIERADVALYAAKRAGRNAIVLAPAQIDRELRSA